MRADQYIKDKRLVCLTVHMFLLTGCENESFVTACLSIPQDSVQDSQNLNTFFGRENLSICSKLVHCNNLLSMIFNMDDQ